MSKNIQNINLFFREFDDRFNQVPDVIAETATEYFKERLIEKDWDGVPYPAYKGKPPTRGSLMMRSNNLFSSIQPSLVSRQRVRISAGGSKVPYARVHNEGLAVSGVRKVNSYTNKNFMGRGKPVVISSHTRTVNYTMPRRQFMGLSATNNERIRNRLITLLQSR